MDYSEQELDEALEEYLESCLRTGNYNMEDNARWFCRENNEFHLDFYEVLSKLQKLSDNY
jgi:hypothetical protein